MYCSAVDPAKRRGPWLALLALAVAPADARAQGEPSLRPIVVTPGQGVAQAAFDTPASVDVIDGATLRNGQLGINLSETLLRVPGVVALNRQNYAQDLQISVRGYGARATFGVRGLRLYVDGIPATAPDGQGQVSHFDLATAGRLEVLRGPFSSLYGNSSGGVISLFTADGAPGHQAEFATAAGSDNVQRHTLRLSGEQGAWNYHVSALRFSTDGWREHSAAERTGFNGKFRLQASTDTRVTLVLNAMDMPGVQDPLGLTRAEFEANPRQASPAALQFDTRKSVNQMQAGATIEHRLDAAQTLKLTTWRGARGTEQFQAIPVAVQVPASHPGGVIALDRAYRGVDAQWARKGEVAGGVWHLTAGLYADELQERRQGFQNFSGTTLGVMGAQRRDEDNRVASFDQYAQGTWSGERFSLTAGLRHSRVKFSSRDHYIAAGNGDDSGATRFSATTPVLGAVYHLSDTMNLYAAVGRGFETPTFNELAYRPNGQTGLNFDLRSASSRQWELGVKAEPLPRWRVNAALFQARTSDEIVVLGNAGGRSTFQNAGATRRRGMELALDGRWGEGWSFHLAATWLDALYAADFLTCTAAPCTTPNALVAAGNRMPGIPRTSAFAEVVWRHRPWGLETALEWRHQGEMATDDRNTDSAARANLFNLRVGLAQRLGRWSLREFLRIDNMAGRKTIGSVIVNEGNRRFFEPAPGRTWLAGVNASYAF
jgi:iron complex outermembrane receptor protein